MDDQLHPADRVEKALEDDRLLGRQHPERGMRRGEVFDELARRRIAESDLMCQPTQDLGSEPPPSHGFAAGPSLPRKRGRVISVAPSLALPPPFPPPLA